MFVERDGPEQPGDRRNDRFRWNDGRLRQRRAPPVPRAPRARRAAAAPPEEIPSGGGTVAGCRMFPADNPWNQDISGTALHPMSATYLANMNPTRAMHPDWGTVTDNYGIPYLSGTGATPQPITWTTSYGPQESDMLPCPTGTNQFCYPIPLNAPIEGGPGASAGSDRHILYVDTAGGPDNCTLYELYQVQNPTGGLGFMAASGAIFHLGRTRFVPTAGRRPTRRGFRSCRGWCARGGDGRRDQARAPVHREPHLAGLHPPRDPPGRRRESALPPMGLRVRLKASFNVGTASGRVTGYPDRDEEVRHHPRRQRQRLVLHRRLDNGWEPYMDDVISTSRAFTAATSRSSTPVRC